MMLQAFHAQYGRATAKFERLLMSLMRTLKLTSHNLKPKTRACQEIQDT